MCGTACLTIRNGPRRLTAITWSQSCASISVHFVSCSGANRAALFTSTSILPNRCERVYGNISQTFNKGDGFDAHTTAHHFVLSNDQSLLKQKRVGIAIADGLGYALDFSESRGFVRKRSQPMAQSVVAGARSASRRTRSAALAAIATAGFCPSPGDHCCCSPGGTSGSATCLGRAATAADSVAMILSEIRRKRCPRPALYASICSRMLFRRALAALSNLLTRSSFTSTTSSART